MTTLQRFDLAAVVPSPWKNGSGATRELACWPPGAGMERFGWRVSVATIDQPGPFSAFAGVDRQIMLLEGDGVHLRARDGSLAHALDQRWQPWAFPGEAVIDCTLRGGTSTDFNLMVRRGAWQGEIEVVGQAVQPGSVPAGLCMVLAGAWQCDGARFTPGQGLWWGEAVACGVLSPQIPDGPGAHEAPALAWIALTQKSESNGPPALMG